MHTELTIEKMNAIVQEACELRRAKRGQWSVGRVVLEIVEKYSLHDDDYAFLYGEVEFWTGKAK